MRNRRFGVRGQAKLSLCLSCEHVTFYQQLAYLKSTRCWVKGDWPMSMKQVDVNRF